MTEGSSPKRRKGTPLFIIPKFAEPAAPQCRWALLVRSGFCEDPAVSWERSEPILCQKHREEVAETVQWVPRWRVEQVARQLAERPIWEARREVMYAEQKIRHLRRWLQEERKPRAEAADKPKREAPVDGTVYFLRVGGYIKIGWTSDLTKRMRQYQPDTQLLAIKPGTRKDERALHRKFAHLKTHGREWFPLAPQITEEITRTVAEHGQPPVVDFSARQATRIVGPRLDNYIGGKSKSA